MSDGKRYDFGTVIRVDPEVHTRVPQPDARRWMVVSFDDRLKWTILYLGPTPLYPTPATPSFVSHWPTLHGFVRVEDET